MFKINLTVAVLFILVPAMRPCFCQQLINKLESYTVDNGLSDGTVTSLLQDKRGFLWMGTLWGLNRYDAKTIKNYFPAGPTNLIDAHVNSLSEDDDGNLWIGTQNGVSCFDPFNNTFNNFQGEQAIVYADKENNIWLGDNQLKLLNPDKKTFRCFNLSLYGSDTRQNKYISSILEDKSGRLWIATSYGIKLFNRKDYSWKSYHFDSLSLKVKRATNACTKLFEDSQGNIWCGTWGGGILKYNTASDKFEVFFLEPPLSDIVFCLNELIVNDKKYLIAGTFEGLGIFTPGSIHGNSIKPLQVLTTGNDNNSLLSGIVNTLFTDRENNLWIGSDKGLQKADMHQQAFTWLDIKMNPGKPIFHMIKDIRDPTEIVYLTTQQGWWKMNLKTLEISSFLLPGKYKKLLSNINNYLITPSGYWFTSQKGFGFYDPYSGEVIDLSNKTDNENEKGSGRLIQDKYGRIWFNVYRNGLRIYDPAAKTITKLFADSMPGSLKGMSITGLTSNKGYVWLSTDYKLIKVDPEHLTFVIYKNYTDSSEAAHNHRLVMNTILIDRKNRLLLIGEQNILEFKNDHALQLFPEHGITNFIIERVNEDSAGNFWIKTNNNFFKVSADFKKWIPFSVGTGINQSTEINEVFHSENNEVILASRGKILYFKQQDLINDTVPPVVMFTALSAGDTTYAYPVVQNSRIHIPYKNSLEAVLSVLNFSNEKDNRIFYKMKGWDNEWKEAGDNFLIRYEQLPPGTYQLYAKGMNSAGIESKETVLFFTVDPPYWRTWWFISLLVLTALAIGYALYRYRVNEIIRQERLRSRIASDLHDDIGATLSSISFYSETLKQQTHQQMPQLTVLLDKMGATSREMVGNMSDIVWAINPKNDNVDHLASRIQFNAAELCGVKNVSFKFMCPGSVYALKLNMEQRRNIYLIYKEAINNALKYSQCTVLDIAITEENKNLVMRIKDNGAGFENINKEGNGLMNMKKRAADIKGALAVRSKINEGTGIELIVPLT